MEYYYFGCIHEVHVRRVQLIYDSLTVFVAFSDTCDVIQLLYAAVQCFPENTHHFVSFTVLWSKKCVHRLLCVYVSSKRMAFKVFSHGSNVALGQCQCFGPPNLIQTEIAQQLLDELPWDFVQRLMMSRGSIQWLWWSSDLPQAPQ